MSQKIKYVKIKDFKGIKELEASNLSRFVAVLWDNGAGKSSFIEAIRNAIKLEKWWNDKVRIGEEKWEIVVEFDDFIIRRVIWENWTLKVEHNGELVQRPQSWLDHIFLWTIGDPQKFLDLHNKEKVRYLLETQGKKWEYDKLEENRVVLYDKRTEIHRKLLSKKEEVESIDAPSLDIDDSVSKEYEKLQKELSEVEEYNAKHYETKERISKWLNTLKETNRDVEHIDTNIERKNDKIAELKKQIQEEEDAIKNLKDKRDEKTGEVKKFTSAIRWLEKELEEIPLKDNKSIMERIEEVNKKRDEQAEIRASKKMYDENVKKRDELQRQYDDLNDSVKSYEKKQNDLVSQLWLWYDLKLDDWTMYVKDWKEWIKLDDVNKALQLSIWVDICLRWPNEVKIITVEDANTLDPKTLKELKEKIENHGAQCFLETVYPTWYEEIIIEDWMSLSDKK